MKRVEGSAGVALLECTNPVLGKWRVRWDVEAKEDGSASYMEEELDHRPDADEIRSLVSGWYNSQTDERILSGFEYDGQLVWLSSENQFNYKAAYDVAVQTDGKNLPVTFKFGTDNVPYYGSRPSGLLREGYEAHSGCLAKWLEKERCVGLGFV